MNIKMEYVGYMKYVSKVNTVHDMSITTIDSPPNTKEQQSTWHHYS